MSFKAVILQLYSSEGGKCGGHMVSAFISGLGGLVSSPGYGHHVVFLGKTLYFHFTQGASLHPGVKWVPEKLMLEGNPAID